MRIDFALFVDLVTLGAVGLVVLVATRYLPSYMKQKGKHLATKEGISGENRASSDVMEVKTGPLRAIFPDDWFKNRDVATGWMRIYTVLSIPKDSFLQIVNRFWGGASTGSKLHSESRVLIGFGHFNDLKAQKADVVLYSDLEGILRVEIQLDQKELPGTNFAFLATPFRDEGIEPNEAVTRSRLDAFAALICLHTGLNFMRNRVCEGEIHLGDGKLTAIGDSWRMPQPAEGPFLASQNAADINEISERVGILREPKRSRVRLALQLMDSAMRAHHGFFEYWTSLEVLCGGKANAMKARVARIYGIKSHAEAAAASGLKTLTDWRHDFFHRGIRPVLAADVDRYIQLLFLDLLRDEIDLPVRGHLGALLGTEGYDLSPLGLPDNRTEEQKRAEEATTDHTTGTTEEGTSA